MSSVHSTISYGMPIGNVFVSGESTVYGNGMRVTSHSTIDKSGKGKEVFLINMPGGYSSECVQKLHSIVPRVSNIMSQLTATNLKDNDLKELAEGYIKNRHQEAAKFCAQKSQIQERKKEVEKTLESVSSDVKSSSLLPSSYVPKDAATYKFPKANYLGGCLERDSATSKENHPYFYEKGIIPKVTETFADQTRSSEGIETSVRLTMEDFKDQGMRPELAAGASMLIIEALKNCAQEKTKPSK